MLSRPVIQGHLGVTITPEVLHLLEFVFVKNHIFMFDLEIDFLTLEMTLNHPNNIINGLSSQNHIRGICIC